MSGRPTFETAADETLERVRGIYAQRGGEYADSWALPNIVTTFTEATLRRFGIELDVEQLRLVQAAALIDVKDSRLSGPWKLDSLDDGIAYRACYASLRERYEREARVDG